MSPEALLRIAAAVAGRYSAADMVRVEVPYARGMNMWKLEQPGKFPSTTKDAIRDIVKGHGGKNPKYEDDGLHFEVPADKADSALEDVKNLSGIDKSFKSLFDAKKADHWKQGKGVKDKPVDSGKKVDPKLEKKSEKYEQKLEKKLEGQKSEPSKPEPKEEESGIIPDDPNEEWNEILDDFGVEGRKRLRKTPPEAAPKLQEKKAPPSRKPAGKPADKPKAKAEGKPARPGRRRPPGPPPKAKFLKSLDRMSQVVKQTDDQQEIVEAVEDFLDGIRYDSWPESA